MAQFTDDQLAAALERTTAKLQTFYNKLPAIERLMLDLAVDRIVAGAERASRGYLTGSGGEQAPADVHGHAVMIGGLWWTPPGDDTGRPSNPIPVLSGEPAGPEPLPPREPRTAAPRPPRPGAL